MKHLWVRALVIVVFSAIFGTAQTASAQDSATSAGTITVTGVGSADALPDQATITTGVLTRAQTATEALDQNSERMRVIIAALQDAGLEDRDIQTRNFSVQPDYVYDNNNDGIQEPPKLVGYTIANDLTIYIRNLEQTGELLDQLIRLGANQVRGISFGVQDQSALMEAARKSAILDARARAELYAETAGVKLGRVLQISEPSGRTSPSPVFAMAASAEARAEVPIAAGEISVSSSITIVFEIE